MQATIWGLGMGFFGRVCFQDVGCTEGVGRNVLD